MGTNWTKPGNIYFEKEKWNLVKATPTKFPLALSYASTVNKLQGISLSKAVVSLNLCKQKAFQSWQLYVVLSCITNFHGLCLTGSYNGALIKNNVAAKDEYERLKLYQQFTAILTKYSENALSMPFRMP